MADGSVATESIPGAAPKPTPDQINEEWRKGSLDARMPGDAKGGSGEKYDPYDPNNQAKIDEIVRQRQAAEQAGTPQEQPDSLGKRGITATQAQAEVNEDMDVIRKRLEAEGGAPTGNMPPQVEKPSETAPSSPAEQPPTKFGLSNLLARFTGRNRPN